MPATLHASLVARLDRLGPLAKEVAQVAAVDRSRVPPRAAGRGGGSDEAELAAALDQLAGAGLVTRRGVPPAAGYLFKHALVRDAAYGTLLRDRRRRLHGRIARALEERSPELAETAPELIALHLTEAGEAGRALGYWLKAGRRSAGRSAEREAARQLRRGLDALRPAADRDRLELEFQLALGPRLVSNDGYTNPDAVAAYERAGALCESLDDVGRLIPTLRGLYAQHGCGASAGPRWTLPSACARAAERGGDPVERLLGHRTVGTALMQLGSLRGGPVGAGGGRGAPRSAPRPCPGRPVHHRSARHGPGLPGSRALDARLPGPGPAPAQEAIRYAAELEHASTTNDVRFHAGAQLAALLGDCRAAEAHAHAVTTVASEYRLQPGGGSAPSCRLGARPRRARGGRARPRPPRRRARRRARQHVAGPRFRCCWPKSTPRLGDLAEALRLVERAQGQVRRTGEDLWQAEVHRAEGELRRLAGAPGPEVEACFAAALAVAAGRRPSPSSCAPRRASPGTGATRAAGRGARSARSRLRLVHRGLRHAGPAGREDAARRAPVARSTAGIARRRAGRFSG